VVEILQRPEVDKRVRETFQLDPMIGSTADAARFFSEETALWGGVIREANVTIP
jgi:hypothetical protein